MANNYFLVNNDSPLFFKHGDKYVNSLNSLADMDRFTLSEGPNLMNNLAKCNIFRVIDVKKKLFIVKTPYQTKYNTFTPLVYNKASKTCQEIIDIYLSILDKSEEEYVPKDLIQTRYETLVGYIVSATKKMPEELQEQIYTPESLIGSDALNAYRQKPWEFLSCFNDIYKLRNLLSTYLSVREQGYNKSYSVLIPTSSEMNNFSYRVKKLNNLEPIIKTSMEDHGNESVITNNKGTFTLDATGQLSFMELTQDKPKTK